MMEVKFYFKWVERVLFFVFIVNLVYFLVQINNDNIQSGFLKEVEEVVVFGCYKLL